MPRTHEQGQHGWRDHSVPEKVAGLVGSRRLIIASNRGPAEFHRDTNGRLGTKRGSGGVVTALAALAALAKDLPLTWVAATMSAGDREAFPDASAPSREIRLGRMPLRVRYVNVPADVYTLHYDTISNEALWFLQHYLWDVACTPTFGEAQYHAWDQGYRRVNAAIADAVADEALANVGGSTSGSGKQKRGQPADGSDAIVLLQDYHLYLAAARVRERLPRATVQQFIHIPWPAMRYWQFLPDYMVHDIYEGLAANDVLGFQTERDARNFLECVRYFLADSRVDLDEGRLIWRRHRLLARAYPVTVDAEEIRRTLASAPARLAAQELAPLLGEAGQVIVRVDRLEPTKNIVRGFLAYETLLRRHPELQGNVRFLAFLVPSRQGLAAYRSYERDVRRTIRHINKTFGTREWQPITAFFENNRARALVAMRRYDVLLVNPVMDGMNLVIKEGPIANTHDGALVLSRTAGAYLQLAGAVLPVTPTDIEETADQLHEALVMSERERQQRAALARQIIAASTPTQWVLDQLRDAAGVKGTQGSPARTRALARVG